MGDEQLSIVLVVDTLAAIGLGASIAVVVLALASKVVVRLGTRRVLVFAGWLFLASVMLFVVFRPAWIGAGASILIVVLALASQIVVRLGARSVFLFAGWLFLASAMLLIVTTAMLAQFG